MSLSTRARRMAAHHLRHRVEPQLNLIPLIDILSAMVAFLLVYSTQVQVIQNSKGILIPESVARQAPHPSLVVMVTPTQVLVRGRPVASVAQISTEAAPVIGPLRDALELAAQRDRIPADAHGEREVTIMADKSLPYAVLKKVMATCTNADYGHVDLAVLEKAEPLKGGPAGLT